MIIGGGIGVQVPHSSSNIVGRVKFVQDIWGEIPVQVNLDGKIPEVGGACGFKRSLDCHPGNQ